MCFVVFLYWLSVWLFVRFKPIIVYHLFVSISLLSATPQALTHRHCCLLVFPIKKGFTHAPDIFLLSRGHKALLISKGNKLRNFFRASFVNGEESKLSIHNLDFNPHRLKLPRPISHTHICNCLEHASNTSCLKIRLSNILLI